MVGDPDSFQNKDDAAESTLAMSGGRATPNYHRLPGRAGYSGMSDWSGIESPLVAQRCDLPQVRPPGGWSCRVRSSGSLLTAPCRPGERYTDCAVPNQEEP